MTLAATRRYAFGASVLMGLLATLAALVLVSALVLAPDQVVLAMTNAELSSLLRLLLRGLAAAFHTIVNVL
jgi:hypothetical protein